MRVCARLSAVQQAKQQKAATAAAAEGPQNGEQKRPQTARKRGRPNSSLTDGGAGFWQAAVATRPRRNVRPMAVEWQQRQRQGVVQASNFDWEQYLAVRGGTAAQNGHLFQQQHFMERTLAQQIFRPGSSVRVRYPQNGENDLWVSARIGVTFPFGQTVVEFPTRTAPAEQTVRNGRIIGMDSGGVRTEIVHLDVVELPESADDDKNAATEGTVNDDFRTILREHREWLGRSLHSFVQEGQLFELQEAPSLSRSDSPPQNVPFASSSATSASQSAAPSAAGSSHNNCLRVHVVRVVAHHNGLVLVERIGRAEYGERQRRELVHITAERCHPLGWTRAQHPSDKYSLAEVDLGERTSTVPRWLFSFRPLATHKFEVGMLLEMLDPLNRLSFVPAYVSERVNSHYFKVRPVRDVQNLTALLRTSDHIVHCTSPDIFPVGWCFKNQIRLTFPRGLNHSDNSFSYAALRLELHNLFMHSPSYTNNNNNGGDIASVFSAPHPSDGVQAVQHEQLHQQPSCSQPAVLPSSYSSALISVPFSVPMEFSFAPDSLFDLPKMAQKRLEFVRYCEVQDAADPTLFYPGAIVRSQQHLVWVHFDRDEHTHRPAQIYSISSPQLFRCGTAKSASGAASFAAAAALLRYFTMPIRIPTALSANCGRNLLRTFTSQRTPVFLPRQKPFLSEMWLKADLWLPPIYLSANCFCGPFLIADKVRALPALYASSPLPHAISTLVKDLLACAAGLGTRGVRELINLLVGADRNSKVPLQMLLKFKYTNRRVRFSVEACERAAQFPGWLRTLLIRLDACPNLLSLEKRDKCPLDCSASLASSLYLCHGGHVNTASAQSSQQQTNKLNQAAQQLKKVVQQQLQLQKRRKNGRNKRAKKSEEGEEYAVRQPPQPFPARREPSKRLSIAQPVLDDDYGDDGEEKGTEKAAEDEDAIHTEKGGQAVEGSRRRRSINGNGMAEDGIVVTAANNDEDDSNSRGTLSTTASNTSGSSQQQTDGILEAKAKQMRQQQQQGDRGSSSSSSSALSDSSVDDDGGDGGPSSPVSSSSSSTTTVPVATALSSLSSAIAAPLQTPPLPPQQRRKAKQTATKRLRGVREGHQQHPMAHQQREIKREQLGNSEEDEVQWYDHQQASIIRNATQQQLANVGPAAQTADMDIVHVVTSQQRQTQHYATPPMPLYTPYLYAAMAPPHHQYNPYAYYYAPVAAPSAASSSSSAVPPFLHHPPPPHVHLMPAPPPPPAMFAPLSANSAAGTSAANNTASTSNYNNATGTSNFGFDCPPVDSNPSRWSAETLCRWLTAAGLADCAQRLLNEEVDGACLLLFTPINYQNLGLKLGPMVKLQQIAEYLRQFTFADNR